MRKPYISDILFEIGWGNTPESKKTIEDVKIILNFFKSANLEELS